MADREIPSPPLRSSQPAAGRRAGPEVMRTGELALSVTCYSNGEIRPHTLPQEDCRAGPGSKGTGEPALGHKSRTDPVISQAHPDIDLSNEWLEDMQGPILQIQSCRNSITQGNNRISERSPVPVRTCNIAKARGFKPDQ